MNLGLAQPAWLFLLPLALLPWWRPRGTQVLHAALAMLPRDPASRALELGLRAAGSLAIATLLLGLADPQRPEHRVLRMGRGAEILLLLDRSRSMDQGFGGVRPGGGMDRTGDHLAAAWRSKGQAARRILADFVARRPHDRFGMIVFSTLPMPVLDFTHHTEAVQAAIAAANVGRGVADTDIGLALLAALDRFEGRPFTGSRVVMLVSDGGDHIEPEVRRRIAERLRRERVSLYWLYLRTARSPGLEPPAGEGGAAAEVAPEVFLHRFFQTLAPQYRAFEVEDPQALQRAVDDVGRLESLPIDYEELVPRRSYDTVLYAVALAAVLALLAAQSLVRARWS